MVIHLLTCLTLAALTSYVVALKLFALQPVPVTARRTAQSCYGTGQLRPQ